MKFFRSGRSYPASLTVPDCQTSHKHLRNCCPVPIPPVSWHPGPLRSRLYVYTMTIPSLLPDYPSLQHNGGDFQHKASIFAFCWHSFSKYGLNPPEILFWHQGSLGIKQPLQSADVTVCSRRWSAVFPSKFKSPPQSGHSSRHKPHYKGP